MRRPDTCTMHAPLKSGARLGKLQKINTLFTKVFTWCFWILKFWFIICFGKATKFLCFDRWSLMKVIMVEILDNIGTQTIGINFEETLGIKISLWALRNFHYNSRDLFNFFVNTPVLMCKFCWVCWLFFLLWGEFSSIFLKFLVPCWIGDRGWVVYMLTPPKLLVMNS